MSPEALLVKVGGGGLATGMGESWDPTILSLLLLAVSASSSFTLQPPSLSLGINSCQENGHDVLDAC